MSGRHSCRCTWLLFGVVAVWGGLAADVAAQGSIATDRAALEAIYRSTGGDDWTNNTNWLSDAPLGTWYGVETGEQGRVAGLWLGVNGLVGSVPAELGDLSSLRGMSVGGNLLLSGQVPPELGNLAGLTDLDLGYTMLSGPLPVSMSRLSTLDWLNLDGSGLCVPDSPAMRAWVATIAALAGAVCDGSVAFSRVVTQSGLGELDHVFAVADLNGDALDDIIVGDKIDHDPDLTPADRLRKVPLHIFVSEGDGTFTHAPQLVDGQIEAHAAVVVAGDLNGDGSNDLVVYDHGAYVDSESSGHGNPPQLYLSGRDGVLHPSDDLANGVREQHEREPPFHRPAAPSDLHLKMATTGDLENDGDLDIWVESDGGNNMNSHFAVNNGDGTFTLDIRNRATDRVHHNSPPTWWRYHEALFLDVDHDGDSDLVLGQLRDPSRLDQFSIILINDGTGYFPARVELPHPAFNDGVTRVFGIAGFDLNRDGADDMLMLHVRNGILGGWSGRFIQALLNTGDGSFVDETSTWIGGDQSATTPGTNEGGFQLQSYGYRLVMHDVDRDGCSDLVVVGGVANIRVESPIVYRNDGNNRFKAMSPVSFAGSDSYFGRHAVPADVNGDEAVDFVVPYRDAGPDGHHDTADDTTILVTLLNTTSRGPIRCADPANRPPAPAGTLPNRTLAPDGTLTVDVSRVFVDPDGDVLTYTVSSSAPGVVAASAAGARVTLTAVGEGTATIRVTATDPGGLSATQSFRVTVSATVSAPFTDDPLQPGVTPIRAVHFTELRTRIDALRSAAGLLRFSWTDPVMRAGVTRVRRVHLLELRAALVEAYRASGRSAPRWSDMSPAATPIRATHVMELRTAVLALE